MRVNRLVATMLALVAGGASADVVLYSSGPLINLPFGGSGGAHASRIQGELGLTRASFGGGHLSGFVRSSSTVADDFTVAAPFDWHVRQVTVYYLDAPLPVGFPSLSLWNVPPWQAGAAPIAHLTATRRTAVGYRVPSDNPTYLGLPLTAATADVDWVLPPGNYWLSWVTGVTTISPFPVEQVQVPPVTVPGQASTGNGRFYTRWCEIMGTCDPIVWQDALDGGAPQGFPFVIQGRPVAMRKGEMGGPVGPDLLFRNVNAASPDFGRHKVWFMNGAARDSEAYLTPDLPGASWEVVGVDDFDTAGAPWNGPDGQADLVVRDVVAGTTQFWLMNGAARVGSALPLAGVADAGPDWKVAATADFDADGRPDIVWRNGVTQQLVVWTMNGVAYRTSILPTPSQAVDANWTLIGAQDFDDDGATDLLWYNETSGRIVLWLMNSSLQRIAGQFATPPQAGDNNWRVVASGDYSRDAPGATPPTGSADVVWRNATSGNMVVWHLDFTGTRVLGEFTSPASNAAPLDWVVAGPK